MAEPASDGLDGPFASLSDLCARAQACRRCPLAEKRRNVAFGEGNPQSPVVLIGEGPGEVEDQLGRPFVGPAGQLLDRILAAVDLDRTKVYITNVVKCRPPGNRVPTESEMQACAAILDPQLAFLAPKLVLAVGNVAKARLLGPAAPAISRCRGQWYPFGPGSILMPIFHPSYLLRNDTRAKGGPKWLTWQDMKELRRRYDLIQAGGPGAALALEPTATLAPARAVPPRPAEP